MSLGNAECLLLIVTQETESRKFAVNKFTDEVAFILPLASEAASSESTGKHVRGWRICDEGDDPDG